MADLMAEKQEEESEVLVSINPATLEEIGRIKMMGKEEVKDAVLKAYNSFDNWASLNAEERAKYLLRVRDYIVENQREIAELINKEMGKPIFEALTADVMVVVDLISFYSRRAVKITQDYNIASHLFRFVKTSKIAPKPIGVVSVISPWNFPFAIPMSGICFALLAGNTVVFKPSPEVVFVGKKIEEIFNAAGLPEGVFNFVICPGPVAGEVLCAPPVRKVVFTGSTETGKKIMKQCAENIIPAVLELGGKDPMIVMEDADLEIASSGAVWGAFSNCGQICASVERVYVQRNVYQRFLDLVVEKTKALRVGMGDDPQTDIGPLVNRSQFEKVKEQVKDAVAKGAKILTGGREIEALRGYFYEPTVLCDVNHTMKCMKEETFGPLLPIMPFDTEEEAISLANDTLYGLTASVWTRDRSTGERLARKIWSGTVCINDHGMTYGMCETPWRGARQSGIGCSHSDDGFREFLFQQHINLDKTPNFIKRRPWWYPYSKGLRDIAEQAVKIVGGSSIFKKIFGVIRIVPRLLNFNVKK